MTAPIGAQIKAPEPTRQVRTIGGGLFSMGNVIEVANGDRVVLLGRRGLADSVMMRPDQARKLADILRWQADLAEVEPPHVCDGGCRR